MNTADAQLEMRDAYFGGAPGVVASAAAWTVAGGVALAVSEGAAVPTLFVCGAFIHPVGVLLSKALGRAGRHSRGNPMGVLALEGTIQFLLALLLAFVVSLHRIEWFFPAMLLLIGGRYLTFSSIYGDRTYWACGGALASAGVVLALMRPAPYASAFAGAAIEFVFACVLHAGERGRRVDGSRT
jgi:hypothetical protein